MPSTRPTPWLVWRSDVAESRFGAVSRQRPTHTSIPPADLLGAQVPRIAKIFGDEPAHEAFLLTVIPARQWGSCEDADGPVPPERRTGLYRRAWLLWWVRVVQRRW